MNWRESTQEDRIRLYKAAKDLNSRLKIEWEELFKRAFGLNAVSSSYVDNLRHGKIGAIRAEELAHWIERQAPNLLPPDLRTELPPDDYSVWGEFLSEHGIYQSIQVIPYRPPGFGIVGASDMPPLTDLNIKIGQSFFFKLDMEKNGTLVAFQGYHEHWFPLWLRHGGQTLSVGTGDVKLPIGDSKTEIKPVLEAKNDGEYKFVFVNVPKAQSHAIPVCPEREKIPSDELDSFVKALTSGKSDRLEVYRCNLMIWK